MSSEVSQLGAGKTRKAALGNIILPFLANLKANLRLVIADMPGGKHPKTGEAPTRITGPTRGHMMQQCDGFIVLCRQDKPTVFEDWQTALREHGITSPVLAKVVSADYQAPRVFATKPSVNEQGFFTFAIDGLSREKSDEELIKALKPAFQELLAYILEKLNHE